KGDLALLVQNRRRNIFLQDKPWLGGGYLHRDVVDQVPELFASSREIRLAVYFYQHPYLSTRVYVRMDQSLGCDSARFLARRGQSALPQNLDCLFFVSSRFYERCFAFHHARTGFVPQRLDCC